MMAERDDNSMTTETTKPFLPCVPASSRSQWLSMVAIVELELPAVYFVSTLVPSRCACRKVYVALGAVLKKWHVLELPK